VVVCPSFLVTTERGEVVMVMVMMVMVVVVMVAGVGVRGAQRLSRLRLQSRAPLARAVHVYGAIHVDGAPGGEDVSPPRAENLLTQGAARAGRHLRLAGFQPATAELSTSPERRTPRLQVGGTDHHQAYSRLIATLPPPGNLVIISCSNPACARRL
jgi:hypothetical protein